MHPFTKLVNTVGLFYNFFGSRVKIAIIIRANY